MGVGCELFYLGLTFSVSLILASLCVWNIWLNQTHHTDMYDISHRIFADLHMEESPLPNYFMLATLVFGIVVLRKWNLIARFIFLQSLFTMLRAITTASTILPNIVSSEYCKDMPETYWDLLGKILVYGTCSDYMFSGHTVTVFLTHLFIHKYKSYWWQQWLSGFLVVLTILSLLILKWHYTVDCIIAIVIVWLSFTVYNHQENDTWYYFPALKKIDESRKSRLDEPRTSRSNFNIE
jgi:hypothetical protein